MHNEPYDYLINPRDLCPTYAPVDYLFLVLSAPEYVDRRNVIRRTWAKDVRRSAGNRVLFLLGKPGTAKLQDALELESLGCGDIVQEDFWDTYRNLSLKSIMLLRWASLHCRQARFVVKIDDDCFPNLANFYRAMQGQPEDAIYGELLHRHIPSRDPLDKWYVPYEEITPDVFPDYIHGAMYVIGGRVVELLYRATGHVRPISMEDVYITGMCAERAGIGRTRLAGTNNNKLSTLCEYKRAIYGHHVTAEEMDQLWYAMKLLEYKCHRLFYSVHVCYCRAVDGAAAERVIEAPVL
ncbi:hypothetical protein HPB52_010947 [Rhipicephalus sanguineus]|uniref:Hexosyltransferase n=2 Tax=Rhipicephalus sanguineus TaxID=34632 RepID=A0A9D4SUC7_RHISA|nr:hypothetical protein HPB52_010947 [Rhipicephalus sanguineus]